MPDDRDGAILTDMTDPTTNSSLPRFCDAEHLADRLEHRDEFRRLRAMIRQAVVAQSCRADLAQAQTCCDALDALLQSPRKRGTLERRSTESALLSQAVLLYGRATVTNTGRTERGPITIADRLTPEQRADHEALLEVRNRAIAHVYLNEQVSGETWHHGLVFFIEDGQGWRPAGASKTHQFHGETFARLKRQLAIATNIVRARFRKRVDAIALTLNESGIPIEAVEACLFDPVERFGSVEAVGQVLQGMPGGETSFPG